MFVLPPQPTYLRTQIATSFNGTNVAGPVLEMSNTLTHPIGPEHNLSVGEGTYVLQDCLLLATPPPHPQEASVISSNPLATTPSPPKAGVKVSLCITSPRKTESLLYRTDTSTSTRSNLGTFSIKEYERESRTSNETSSDGRGSQLPSSGAAERTPVFGENNILLTPNAGKEGPKRKKPKTNLVKSNSQFISRVITHDSLSKRLQEHHAEGLFAFANIDRAYQWLDLSSASPARAQPLMKILFTKAHMLCHDINQFTKSPNHIDVIMGASTGDIVWFEAYSQKYVRINKGNTISTSPISEIRWLPGSENLFLASHMDGSLIVYDKERDDAAFIPDPPASHQTPETPPQEPHPPPPLQISKSVLSPHQKTNPVASYTLPSPVSAFAFSPSGRHLAVVSAAGTLHLLAYLTETLTDTYPSYYGAFTCVCWSPDGKYVITGGQDDLVSIWCVGERRLMARGTGHRSWVTSVAFDRWRCDGRNYRFGSVGEDRRLLLWDFNVGMLRRPKVASIRNRASASSAAQQQQQQRNRTESQATVNRLRSTSSLDDEPGEEQREMVEHGVESRTVTAELPPVMSKVVDEHSCSWVGFEEKCVIVACKEGHLRVWGRPDVEGGVGAVGS